MARKQALPSRRTIVRKPVHAKNQAVTSFRGGIRL